MKKLRKFLNASVMVMTILAMSGLGMFTPNYFAKAAASAGDLIKMEGNSSVYYFDGAKRFVFPNEATYFSWYSDFSGVVTIPSSELQSYLLGGNVVMRPGTKLVKITTDPKVYAVEANGVLRHVQTEAQAIALYGTDWAKRVVDVPDAFFTNYTIGTPLASGNVPAGSLVKNAGSASVYYYDGTNYRSIASEAAMTANRLSFANVLTITNPITAGGNAITGMETAIVKTSQGGTTTGPVITGSGLMVSLNSSTPASASVPNNASRIPMAKVNLTAANDGAVTVNSITVKRIGLSSYDKVDKVWAEQNGNVVASKKSMNSNDESILVFAPALTVPAGQTITIDLYASLTSAEGNIGLSIVSASAVSATAAAISGSFPINGNLMSPTTYTVSALNVTSSAVLAPVRVGDENVELGRFTVELAGSNRDTVLTSIMLKNNGVEDLSATAMNLYLETAGAKVSSNYTVDGRYITFNFPAGGFDLLKDDSSKIFYIKGDIIRKESTATNSYAIVLAKSADLSAHEKATGFGVNVNTADNYAIANVKIEAGELSISKKATSPSDDTLIKGEEFTALIANVRADEAINVDGLNIMYTSGSFASTTNQFENVRVYVNNMFLDSFDPSASTTLASSTKAVDSSFTLNAGDNEIKIVARARTTATDGVIKFVLDSTIFDNHNPEYVASGNQVTTTVGGSATGGEFTVGTASLQTVRNDGYADQKTIVKGSSNVSLGKFVVKASNGVVKITSVALSSNASTTGGVASSNINDIKVFVDGAQVGNTVNFSSGATVSSLNINIAKDATKNVELFGSFDSSAAGGFKTVMTLNAQDERGVAVNTGNVATTTEFVVVDAGELVVELGGNTPAAGILASKAGVEHEVAQIKLTALNDSANLTEINVENWAGGSSKTDTADSRIASIRLYDGATLVDSFVPVEGAGKFVMNNNLNIAANGNKTLSIKVVLNDIVNDSTATNQDIALKVTTVKAKTSAGSEYAETPGITANNFRVRKTVPTVALMALPTTNLTAGEVVVSKFSVTADANGDVTLGKVVISVATSTDVVATGVATNAVRVNGAVKNASSSLVGTELTVDFRDSTPEVIAAGTTKTFEVMMSVTATGTESQSLSTKINEAASYDSGENFYWSDGASIIAPTWSTGHRVPGLPTTTQVLSK